MKKNFLHLKKAILMLALSLEASHVFSLKDVYASSESNVCTLENYSDSGVDINEWSNEDFRNYIQENYFYLSENELDKMTANIMEEAQNVGVPITDEKSIYIGMYKLSKISLEDKEDYIKSILGLTDDDLKFGGGVTCAESAGSGTMWGDAYYVANNFCTRANDSVWVQCIGSSVSDQFSARSQYEVIPSGAAQKKAEETDLIAQVAFRDRLFVYSLTTAIYNDPSLIETIRENMGLELFNLIPVPYEYFVSKRYRKAGRFQINSESNNHYDRSTNQIMEHPRVLINNYYQEKATYEKMQRIRSFVQESEG